jgi:hypothetical protein
LLHCFRGCLWHKAADLRQRLNNRIWSHDKISAIEVRHEDFSSRLRGGATAATATILGLPQICASETGRFANPLKIPALLEGAPGAEGKIYDLSVAAGKSEFLPGISTPTLGINGAYLAWL